MRDAVFPFFNWLGHTPLAEAIRSSAALIALGEIIHLIGLVLLAGTVLMVDMSMLGFGIRRHPVARIASELDGWTKAGLVILLVSGPLILSSEARKCWDASFFWIKMALLIAALVFHFAVYRRTALAEPPVGRRRARAVAVISLVLWVGVALAGKMIGIYGDDLRKLGEPASDLAAAPGEITDIWRALRQPRHALSWAAMDGTHVRAGARRAAGSGACNQFPRFAAVGEPGRPLRQSIGRCVRRAAPGFQIPV